MHIPIVWPNNYLLRELPRTAYLTVVFRILTRPHAILTRHHAILKCDRRDSISSRRRAASDPTARILFFFFSHSMPAVTASTRSSCPARGNRTHALTSIVFHGPR